MRNDASGYRVPRVALALSVVVLAVACADLLTEPPLDADVFDAPVAGLTAAEMAAFARGDAEFSRRFAPSTGLGPIFNNASCFSCHSGDGRGRLDNSLQRIGSRDDDFLVGMGGPQIQDKAIPGAEFERIPPGVAVSVRLPPPVFGMGLIEAIPDDAILARADPTDADGDGISGRPNMVSSPAFVPHSEIGGGPGLRVGRFGRKAQVTALFQQVAEAYHQDIGITSEALPLENRNPRSSVPIEAADLAADPEVSSATLQAVVHYVRALAPPASGALTPRREQGRQLFATVGCASCHVPTLLTGPHRVAALSDQEVTLYSDLLLHDMGDALADGRPDGDAGGREWRTTPLWGLRVMRKFLAGDAFLLHDGRARSVDEAIRLHGGEAQRARDAFVGLGHPERAALLDFVESR